MHVREVECRDEWDAIVMGLGGHLRQSWTWTGLCGRAVHRRAVLEGDHPVAAIALREFRVPWVPFTVLYASRGPVLDASTDAGTAMLLDAIREIARARRAVFVRFSPPAAAGAAIVERLAAAGAVVLGEQWTLWNAPRVVMLQDLRGTEADVTRAMRSSTRLSLRKASDRGAAIERGTDAEMLARFHRLLTTGRAHLVRGLRYFEALRERVLCAGGVVVLASFEGRDIAGVVGARFGREAYVLYSALAPEHRALRAGVAVHWELIRWAREQGCDRMDWGGAVTPFPPRETDPGYGIYLFKRGFGCELRLLSPYVDLVCRPLLYRALRVAERHEGWVPAHRLRGWRASVKRSPGSRPIVSTD